MSNIDKKDQMDIIECLEKAYKGSYFIQFEREHNDIILDMINNGVLKRNALGKSDVYMYHGNRGINPILHRIKEEEKK